MTKFSPGPWEVYETHNGRIYITSPGGRQITPNIDVEDGQDRADYDLMAASPDGYALAEAVAEHFKDTDAQLGEQARMFLAKARGEE